MVRALVVRAFFVLAVITSLAVSRVSAADNVDFAGDIKPIFEVHCSKCHGPDKQEAGLRLDHRTSALRGGDSGVAIVAGNADTSELVRRITAEDADERMPPADAGPPLTASEIALVRRWIDAGAVWPADASDGEGRVASKHWAYQPIARTEPPKVDHENWVRTPVDAFILERLEKEKLAPSPRAARETLLRRLYLDLTGLLPSLEESRMFLDDPGPKAYEHLVENLLGSAHFGERWGRHWLDLARYGDSNGYELDIVRPNAWRYRDWVVNALNDDMPYDRFIVEQLAGDLLEHPTLDQQIATGFHRMTLKNTESGINKEDYRNREMVDRVNTTGSAVLGTTVGCAQCHSHKYDPISQAEYYQLYAFFNNVEEIEIDLPGTPAEREAYAIALAEHWVKWLALQARGRILDELSKRGVAKSVEALEAALEKAQKQLEAQRRLESLGLERWNKETSDADMKLLSPPSTVQKLFKGKKNKGEEVKAFERYLASLPNISAGLERLLTSPSTYAQTLDEPTEVIQALATPLEKRSAEQEAALADLAERLPKLKDENRDAMRLLVTEERYLPSPHVLALKEDATEPRSTHVLLRGDFKQEGAEIEADVPAAWPAMKPRSGKADRLDFAHWIVDPKNPLTARVAVNHIWSHLFGIGLVATIDDFGTQGEKPSHPELLDWLASELIRNGWSRKQLIRTILLSSAYQQSSAIRSDLAERDPRNELVARQERWRVEAEIVRDLFLSVSSLLDPTLGGPTIYPHIPDSVRDIAYKYKLIWPTSQSPECYRRGMYIHFRRSNPYPSLTTFDAPEGTVCTAMRNRSNTPLQALTTLNDPVFIENVQVLGQRVLVEAPEDLRGRIEWLFNVCLSRSPTVDEITVVRKLFEAERASYREQPDQAAALVGESAEDQDDVAETAAWIATARAVTNLDEFLTRE
jgi:mono/diheme cytochrome c family protein